MQIGNVHAWGMEWCGGSELEFILREELMEPQKTRVTVHAALMDRRTGKVALTWKGDIYIVR
ncbi:hypothetical protein [Geomonas edaphica]|uniref:hypothetical protein n=1 Tax=Geomonas edaphica TaxID=2570226 RepID=UPI0010A77750|nr:hypothetical protein [Geomonas edaphica]